MGDSCNFDPSLCHGLLLDMQQAQRDAATALGRIEEGQRNVHDSHAGVLRSIEGLEKRVGRLEKTEIRRAGFLTGLIVVAEPVIHFMLKKVGLS